MVFSLMFFVLSKLLDIAADPVWWVLTCLVLAFALRRRKAGPSALVVGLVVLTLMSLPSVSNRLWSSLEAGAVKTERADVTYDVVVLLGGVISPSGSLREEPALNDNVERMLEVRRLLMTGRAKVAILSGGSLGGNLGTEADQLAKQLLSLGVPADQLIIENKANNTRENATLSKPLLEAREAKTVLLVTSAFHMRRAVGCFRAVGVEADALPVDWRVRDASSDTHVMPRGEYLAQSTRALREWLGRGVYAVLGYTK